MLSAGFYDAYYKKAAQVRRLIRQDYLNVLSYKEQIRAAEASVAQAEEAYKIATVRYSSGVGINLVLRASYSSPAKSATMAFWVFLAFYIACIAVTWFVFLRKPSTLTTDVDEAKVAVTA